MLCYIIFKKKLRHVGHNYVIIIMWVTFGLFCGSVGQMGQQGQPTFNPCIDASVYSYYTGSYTTCVV